MLTLPLLPLLLALPFDLEPLAVGEHTFQRRELANGLRAVAVQDAGETVSVFVVVGVGNRDETAETTGLAHLVEHALFTGTPTTGVDEHERSVSSWGGESNAFTRQDYTLYYDHDLPPARLAEVLAMEADRLRNLTFDEPAVLHERERLRVEEANTFQASDGRDEELEAAVFRVHPYRFGVRDADGHTRAPKLGVDLVEEFYERHYHPDRVCVVVAGPAAPEVALDAIEAAFGALPAGAGGRSIPSEPPVEAARTERIPSILARDRVELVWVVPPRDRAERPALEVLTAWLDRAELEDGTPIDASIGGRLDQDLLRVGAGGEDVGAELVALVERARTEILPAAELAQVQALLADDLEGVPLRARPYFSLAATFGTYEVFGQGEWLAARSAAIADVTPEQVAEAARVHLRPDRCVTVVFEGTGAEVAPLPADPSALAAAAADAADAGDYDRALEAYTRLLASGPNRMNTVIYLATRGQLHLSLRDYDAAIADFETALEVVDYPAVRELLEEAHARKKAAMRGEFEDVEKDAEDEPAPGSEPAAEAEAGPEPDPTVDEGLAATLRSEVARTCEELERWRGLRFLAPVEPVFVEEASDEKLGGWYESDTGRLVVVTGKGETFSRGAQLHEIFHALQDQAWDLSVLHEGAATTDERHALTGLIEGEAMLAVAELLDYDFEQHARIPAEGPIDRERFDKIFHYGTGLRYVRALRNEGGWAAVNRRWGVPPRATSELFHPGRTGSDMRIPLFLPPPDDGEVVATDVLGELELRWLLTEDESTRALAERLGRAYRSDRSRRVATEDGEREEWFVSFVDRDSARAFVGEAEAAWRGAGWRADLRDAVVLLTREH